MRSRFLTFAMFGLVSLLLLTGCGQSSTTSGGASTGRSPLNVSAPTYTPAQPGIPTSTPVPPPDLWTQPVTTTDIQGFRFSVQVSTVSFTPMIPSYSGYTFSAPPGQGFLDLHFKVTNLLTDRSSPFQISMIGLYGDCSNHGQDDAPNGQCHQGDIGVVFIVDADYQGGFLDIPAGGTGDFHAYAGLHSNTNFEDWTMWLKDYPGDGTFSSYTLVGGVHLLPISGGQPSS